MKKVKILLIALILILGGMFFSQVNAVSLKAQETRPFSDDNSDGTVGNDTYRFLKMPPRLTRGYTIFKLYEDGDTVYSKAYYCLRGRVGFGATPDSDVTTDAIEYTKLGEMHENSTDIINKYKEYYNVDLNRTETITFQGIEYENINIYNAILWILDNLYIPTDNSEEYIAENYKTELLDKAGISDNREEITKDDLEVIQQLAIWYFANYDQQSDDISVSRADEANPAYLLGIISNGDNSTYNNNMFLGTRGANLNKIYQYLINNAIQGSVAYGTNDVRKLRVQSREFDKSIALGIESIDYKETKPNVYHPEEYYYKIGPFKIGTTQRNTINSSDIILLDAQETEVPRFYTFKDELTNTNTTYEVYYFVDKSGNIVDTLQEGIEYYIQVKKLFTKDFKLGTDIKSLADYDMSKVTLKTSSAYSTNTADFFIRENADQPVVEVNKKIIVEGDEITTKTFDLSLRKFIISITRNGENVQITDRTPSIDVTKLNTTDTRTNKKITTAEYNHKKDPVEVEAGDTVTYRIATYNEGDIAGFVYSIKDYLPQYLEFVPTQDFVTSEEIENYIKIVETGKSEEDLTEEEEALINKVDKAKYIYSFDEEKRVLEITNKEIYLITGPINCLWKLEAYNGGETLDSKYIDLTFKVNEKFVPQKDTYLTNVATMTYGSKSGMTAETPEIDRDSKGEEFTVPSQEQLVSESERAYDGNTSNKDKDTLSDSTYHYEGQQDDDDFEKLVVKGKAFDLALRKYITKVERVNKETNELKEIDISSRTPQIETKNLNGIDSTTGKKITTAEYKHRKDPVEVEVGDIVTYSFSVYNEGEIDGYVYSITDYLPEGLTFDAESNTNFIEYKENNDYEEEDLVGKEYAYRIEENRLEILPIEIFMNKIPEHYDTLFSLKAFNGTNLESESKTIDVKFKVTAENSNEDQILTNVATMSYGSSNDLNGLHVVDRDSNITGEEFDVPTSDELLQELPGYIGNEDNKKDLSDSDCYYAGQQDDDDFEKIIIKGEELDLALRKYITKVERVNKETNELKEIEIASRTPQIETKNLNGIDSTTGKRITTAEYNHKKDPVEVEVGDIVTYRFSVYNEGDIDGYVYSITDYLPEGLELDTTDLTKKDSDDENLEIWEKDVFDYSIPGNTYHSEFVFNKNTRVLTITRTTYHASSVIDPETGNLKDGTTDNFIFKLKAFDGATLDSDSIDVKFKVTAQNSNEDQVLTNVATMAYGSTENLATEQTIADRDSKGEEFTLPSQEQLVSESERAYDGNISNKDKDTLNDSKYHYEGQQDDDDFEKIVIKGKPFDLSLRKFITSIKRNGKEVEFDDRKPQIDLTTLINGSFDRNGKKEYTATYNHSKDPLVVKKGDIVTYTLRIYNEGERDGFATEITDYIPEGLALILNYNTNFDNGWGLPKDINTETQLMDLVGEKGFYKSESDVQNLTIEDFEGVESLKDVQLATGKVTITSNMLQEELIKAFDKDKKTKEDGWQPAYDEEGNIVGGLYYKDVQVSCLVIAENTYKDTITNVAEISEDKDKDGNDVIDRDSTPNDKKDPYTTWQEDDDDYEPVVLKYFDLALRKFITGVETAGKTENVTSRIPTPKMGEDGNIVYEHSKDPVKVANNDTVIYTIRVYNEGTLAGYAEEITDDIPEGLEYLPEHSINKKYDWKMYDKDGEITENVEEAVKITTDYLSEAKEIKSKMTVTDETTGETATPTSSRNNLIKPFDSSKAISNKEPLNPDYKDVQVAFKVTEPNTSDRIIVNSAQISKDSDDDEDSDPGKWNEGEDDQDREYIYVKYFDLSLLKWVTQTVVTVDGKTTTTETGFKPNTGKTETTGIRDNNESEPIAKVEIDRKKLSSTTVKFVYNIRVTNEGEIAGYATEITDYIPEGLEFLEEDNKAFGWVKEGEDKVNTRALETVLLQPGESADLQIVFKWKNDASNLGLKTNIAEIREDYNEYDSKDIDSKPGNKENPYEKEQEDDDDFALVILSIKTGKGASYTILIISMLALLAGGMYLIKRYVLKY